MTEFLSSPLSMQYRLMAEDRELINFQTIAWICGVVPLKFHPCMILSPYTKENQ